MTFGPIVRPHEAPEPDPDLEHETWRDNERDEEPTC